LTVALRLVGSGADDTPPSAPPNSKLFQLWVTSVKTHLEHDESALTLIADMPGDMDFRRNGPLPDSCGAKKEAVKART
jgi:hypothetical protein